MRMYMTGWYVLFGSVVALTLAKPTVYMKNQHDKLEPYLLAVSSTVIPIPVYQVSSGFNIRSHKSKKAKYQHLRPNGPTGLITVSGIKKMMANEKLKPN